jgi:hypothetical protein
MPLIYFFDLFAQAGFSPPRKFIIQHSTFILLPGMIPRKIRKKIRQIELRSNRIVTETFAGQYHSMFKGQSTNFDEGSEP